MAGKNSWMLATFSDVAMDSVVVASDSHYDNITHRGLQASIHDVYLARGQKILSKTLIRGPEA